MATVEDLKNAPYTEILPKITPDAPFAGEVGEKFIGAIGMLSDMCADNFRHALRSSWVGDSYIGGPGPAYDALTPGGRELGLPRYPPEPWDQYHARLNRVWEDMQVAGDESSLLAQLTATGFPNAVIITPHEWPDEPGPAGELPYWSQFWIIFLEDVYGVSPAVPYDGFDWGDETLFGISGVTTLLVQTLQRTVRQFKPAHWICRGITFVTGSGWLIGDTRSLSTLTGLGYTFGGETITIGV